MPKRLRDTCHIVLTDVVKLNSHNDFGVESILPTCSENLAYPTPPPSSGNPSIDPSVAATPPAFNFNSSVDAHSAGPSVLGLLEGGGYRSTRWYELWPGSL